MYFGLRGEGRWNWEGMAWIWIIWLHWNHLNLIIIDKYVTCNLNIVILMHNDYNMFWIYIARPKIYRFLISRLFLVFPRYQIMRRALCNLSYWFIDGQTIVTLLLFRYALYIYSVHLLEIENIIQCNSKCILFRYDLLRAFFSAFRDAYMGINK